MQRIRKRLPRRFRLGVPAASAGRFRLLPGCFRAGFVWGSGGCIIWLLIWFQGCFQNRRACEFLCLQGNAMLAGGRHAGRRGDAGEACMVET